VINNKRQFFFDLFKAFDIVILIISFIIAIQINFKNTLSIIEVRINNQNFVFGFFLLLLGYLVLKNLEAYNFKKNRTFLNEFKICLCVTIINSLFIASTAFLFQSSIINIKIIVIYIITCMSLLALNRIIFFTCLRITKKFSKKNKNVFIAGTNSRAIQMSKKLSKLGYVIKGFIDKNWRYQEQQNIPLIQNFDKALREQSIDEVIICLPMKTEYKFIQSIIEVTEEQGILTRLSINLFDLKIAKAKIEYFDEEPILTLFTGNMYQKMILIKYFFDTITACILFLLTLPIFIITILTIKFTSKGPVFFLQERLGINKRLFKVIKFRTMIIDAENKLKDLEYLNERKGEAVFKIKKDPRVTSIGSFLRKFSIDELPQLLNVIKGDMSLVGPRPLPVRDYRGFNKDWQRRRFSVKPGMTCIWQISGRDNITFENWMHMDNLYIDTWTFWLDLKILIKTIPAVFSKKGAS
jgi:exopolysaccharide biosynthesis polyprenyl glycosylphosphotransferase